MPPLRGGRCALATQAFVRPIWGMHAADWLAQGQSASDVTADLVAREDGRVIRQIHMIDASGATATHKGADFVD